MKKLLATVSILSLMTMMVFGMARAATEAMVTASVSIGEISVSVAPDSFDYGSLPFSGTKKSFVVLNNANIKAEVGTVETNLDIKGASTTDWMLGDTPGSNIYVHEFGTSTASTTEPSTYTALTTDYTTFATHVPINGVVWFALWIKVPTSGATAQQNANVTLRATWSG